MPKLNRQIQYVPKTSLTQDIQDQIDDSINEALAPESLAFSYNLDKTVDTIVGATTNLVFSYNPDKTVNTINDGTNTLTFTYNPDKTVDDIIVS